MQRRKFSREFKLEAIRLLRERGVLISFEHERQSHEDDFAANPDMFCKNLSDTLLSSGRLDVRKNSTPPFLQCRRPNRKPKTRRSATCTSLPAPGLMR